MMEHLPWEALDGPKYHAQAAKPRKKWVTAGGWGLSVLLLAAGVATRYYVMVAFGFLYALALAMEKDTVITERGLETFYQMRITTHYDLWKWEEISVIVREDRGHPELVRLHIGRGNTEKALFFKKAEAEKITALAKKRNPSIRVLDAEKSTGKK